METFKAGDRVYHRVYGEVTVTEVDEDRKLIAVASDHFPNLENLVHPVSLTKVTKDA